MNSMRSMRIDIGSIYDIEIINEPGSTRTYKIAAKTLQDAVVSSLMIGVLSNSGEVTIKGKELETLGSERPLYISDEIAKLIKKQ